MGLPCTPINGTETLYQSGLGIIVKPRFVYPEITFGQIRTLGRLPEIEVGQQYAVGQDVLHLLRKQLTIDN